MNPAPAAGAPRSAAAGELGLRLALLAPAIAFGVSRLDPVFLAAVFILLLVSPAGSVRRSKPSAAVFAMAALMLAATLADRPIQGPNTFPNWRGINWKTWILADDFFLPAFAFREGGRFEFVYYCGMNALAAAAQKLVPAPVRGEASLEAALGVLALLYQAAGLALLFGLSPRLSGWRAALPACLVFLFLPGVEVLAHGAALALGKTQYLLWPDWWLGASREWGAASQPELGWALSWVPQQSALLFLQAYFWLRPKRSAAAAISDRMLVLVSALPTSVFFAVGWGGVMLLEAPRLLRRARRAPGACGVPLAAGLFAAASCAFFYARKAHPERLAQALDRYDLPFPLAPLAMLGFLAVENAWLLAGLAALALRPLARAPRGSWRRRRIAAALAGIALPLALLVPLSQVRLGIFNDLYMRGAAPILSVAMFRFVLLLARPEHARPRRALFATALLLGFCWQLAAHFGEDPIIARDWLGMEPAAWLARDEPVTLQYQGRPSD